MNANKVGRSAHQLPNDQDMGMVSLIPHPCPSILNGSGYKGGFPIRRALQRMITRKGVRACLLGRICNVQ